MTRPHVPPSRAGDPQLARDVAKQLDRRRLRRRLAVWSTLLAGAAAAALYLRCGTGFGLGGTGQGIADLGDEDPPRADGGPRRCAIRVAAAAPDTTGITVDSKPMTRDEAVAACKAAGAADVIVTGDAREGDWKELRAALETAGVTDISVR
jgi:hypothetical protein